MRTIYLFLTLIFFYVQANGQSGRPDRQWRFGVLAGRPVAGKIYDNAKMKSASGLVAGLDFGYYFEKRESGPSLHFQPSFTTFKKTETDGAKTDSYYVESQWKWEAIHLPLSFRYTLPTGRVRPFVELGFNFRIRTAFSLRGTGSICGIAGCTPVSSGGSIQNVTDKDKLGILAGVGVEVDAGKFTIPLNIRLVDSIIKKRYEDPAPTAPQLSPKTKLIQLTTGITF